MATNNKNNNELNFNNYKIGDFNLIANTKNIFWLKQLTGYDLQKKANREAILNDYRDIISETNDISKSTFFPFAIHNIRIKRKFDISEYMNFLDFILEVLSYINKDLYEKYSKVYIPYLKEELNRSVGQNNVYSYYYGLSYGGVDDRTELYKDYYYHKKLPNDKELFETLLMKTDNLLNFNDGTSYEGANDNDEELNASMFLHQFFPNSTRNSISFNVAEGKKIVRLLKKEENMMIYFEEYLKRNYEDFISKGMKKYKYKDKLWYNLIKIYEDSKRKFLGKAIEYEDKNSMEIKEGLNFLKIEPYFVKMYFIHPEKQELPLEKVEKIFSDSTENNGFLIQYTTSTPLKGTDLEFEVENILGKVEGGNNPETQANIKNHLQYGIWKTCHYYIVFAEREEMFSTIERKLEGLRKGYGVNYNIDNNLSYFVPGYRKDVHNFYTFGYNIPGTETFVYNPNDSFFNYYPKNIIYQKGIFLGHNLNTFYPVFYHPFDSNIVLNKNVSILGKSGSGKTFMTKLMIERGLSFAKYIIVDHLKNYSEHCKALGGYEVKLNGEKINFLFFNPINNMYDDEGLMITKEIQLQNHIEDMTYLLKLICKFDKNEINFVSIILKIAYNNKKIDGKVKLKHLEKITKKYLQKNKEKLTVEQVSTLGNIIKSFERIENETIGSYLNSDKTADFQRIFANNNYILLNFQDIKPESTLFQLYGYYVFKQLQTYALQSKEERKQLIQSAVKQGLDENKYKRQIGYKGIQPFQVMIDEVWQYLKDEYIGGILYAFAKQIRNMEGGLVPITQELTDLLKNEMGAALFSQSNSYIIFKGLRQDEVDKLEKVFKGGEDVSISFDDSDKKFLLSPNDNDPGKALLKFGRMPIQKVKIYGQDYIEMIGLNKKNK